MESISQELRQAVLQAAIQGKLTKQLPEEENEVKFLIEEIKKERDNYKIKNNNQSVIDRNEIDIVVPDSWAIVPLGDIVLSSISYGIIKLGIEDANGVYVLRCSDVKSGYINTKSIRTVTKELSSQFSRTILQEKDVVINVRGTLGGCAVITKEMIGYNIAREVALVRCAHSIESKYIMYLLLSPYFNDFMTGNLKGIAYKGLNMEKLRDFPVPLPSVNEQRRIIEKIEELMAKIEDLEKVENKLRALHQAFPGDMKDSLLQAAMQGKLTEQLLEDGDATSIINRIVKRKAVNEESASFDIPSNWKCALLSDISEMYTGDSISETEKAQKYMGLERGYDYIGTKDIGFDHVIQYNNGVKIPEENPKFRHAYPGATLLCIEGGSAGRKIAMLDKMVCFGNKLCMFHSELLNKKYLYYYLQSPDFLSAFKNNVTGIIGGVSIAKLKGMIIPVPPLAEQQRIVEKLDKLLPLCDSLQTA